MDLWTVFVFVGIFFKYSVTRTGCYEYSYEYDEYPPLDLLDMFKSGSDFCQQKSKCSNTDVTSYPDKSCYCDEICDINNDCCDGYSSNVTQTVTSSLMTCISDREYIKQPGFGYLMVDKCHPNFEISQLSSRCQESTDARDVTLKLPVTSQHSHVVYKNMYCAFCNREFDIHHWYMEVKCEDGANSLQLPTNISQCDVMFWPPKEAQHARLCPNRLVVESCPDSVGTGVRELEIKDNCSRNAVNYVYGKTTMYKNKYCAMCHSFSEDEIFCEQQEFNMPEPTPRPPDKRYSFRILIDFNSNQGRVNDSAPIELPVTCQNDEIFDLYTNQCRTVYCFPPRMAYKGKCVYSWNNGSDSALWNTTDNGCTFVRYTESEYEFINNSAVFIIPLEKVYNLSEIQINGSAVFVCIDNSQTCSENCNKPLVMFEFDTAEQLLSTITLIVSLISLAVTFTVYVSFPTLLNTPGKILLCLIVSLFFAQFFFLVAETAEGSHGACVFMAIVTHFFYLSSFCWLNIIALDLWMTFSRQFISAGSESKSSRRMYYYCTYAWGFPLLVVLSAVILDNVHFDAPITLAPSYGDPVCWIGSRDALLLFFVGPIGLSELFNIVSFVFTSCHIARANKQGARARGQANTCSLLIIIKLALVMGMTWVFAFVASIVDVSVLWYMFICFNCLQGFYICICFVCTKKVIRLLKEKAEEMTTTRSSASTQLTSLDKSTEKKRSA